MGYFGDRAADKHFRSAIVQTTIHALGFQGTSYHTHCSHCGIVGTLREAPTGCAPSKQIIDDLTREHAEWHKAGLGSGRPAPNPAQCTPRHSSRR